MSNIYEYIKMAIHNIMANKGRSFLTMLGIIIGIASVIAIVSIGEGTKNQMNSEINDIGGGQIAVYCSDDAIADQVWIESEDIDAVRELDGVEGVNVSDSYTGETVTGKGDFNLTVTGEAQDAKLVDNASVKYGSYFGQKEVEEGKNVCVISDADAKRLFGTDDVVGMTLDITCYDLTKTFRICGVTTQKENGTFVSYTYDGMPVTINVPYTAMDDFTGSSGEFYQIIVQADKSLDSGRGYRCYEHHAGIRHRAYQGDRYPEIPWSENLVYYVTVPCGGGNPDDHRRADRYCAGDCRRLCDLCGDQQQYGNDHHTWDQCGNHPGGYAVLLCSRCVLRNLSGEKGSETEPDRGT